jgi:hypothetical protein
VLETWEGVRTRGEELGLELWDIQLHLSCNPLHTSGHKLFTAEQVPARAQYTKEINIKSVETQFPVVIPAAIISVCSNGVLKCKYGFGELIGPLQLRLSSSGFGVIECSLTKIRSRCRAHYSCSSFSGSLVSDRRFVVAFLGRHGLMPLEVLGQETFCLHLAAKIQSNRR